MHSIYGVCDITLITNETLARDAKIKSKCTMKPVPVISHCPIASAILPQLIKVYGGTDLSLRHWSVQFIICMHFEMMWGSHLQDFCVSVCVSVGVCTETKDHFQAYSANTVSFRANVFQAVSPTSSAWKWIPDPHVLTPTSSLVNSV